MNFLRHVVEPERLLLIWQPSDEGAPVRTRRIVGEVFLEPDGQGVFRYLKATPDFAAARAAGFKGVPAFPLEQDETRQGVIESLLRRLPPRKREDFAEYLAQHRLPSPFRHSDFALLGYTGARLPSDGFALVPVFPAHAVPCDCLLEIAGLRHVFSGDMAAIREGDPLTLQTNAENPVDPNALAVLHRGQKIGYVNRAMLPQFHAWLRDHVVKVTVERLNGKPDRPLIYAIVRVT
jgi:hypothetical protein